MLTPEQKKELDDNIKLMLSKGSVTKEQILDYYKKFLAKYDKQQTTPPQQTPKQVMSDWSSYPCVPTLANQKGVTMSSNGSFLIGNFRYWANGRKGNITSKENSYYTCNDPEFQAQQIPDNTQIPNKSTYTICPEILPVKKSCKNEIVRDVQRCLRDKHQMGIKVDGYFGPKTEKALIKLGLKGDVITAKEYNIACTPTDLGQSSKPNTTGYDDYSNDEYEDSSEKPEQEFSTGYEDYTLEEN
jgi:hypothetical protein